MCLSGNERREMTARIAGNAQQRSRVARTFLEQDGPGDRLLRADRRPTDLAAALRRVVEAMDAGSHPLYVDVVPVVAEVAPSSSNVSPPTWWATPWLTPRPARRCSCGSPARSARSSLSSKTLGPGIPDALKSEAFERSRTGDATAGGTGLGLWILARVAKLHGGRAWVEDRPGGGAAFRVLLAAEGFAP
jgi:Histidine kinase-, DNA gyrase B-, and HSP90-like ATPase